MSGAGFRVWVKHLNESDLEILLFEIKMEQIHKENLNRFIADLLSIKIDLKHRTLQ